MAKIGFFQPLPMTVRAYAKLKTIGALLYFMSLIFVLKNVEGINNLLI
jgi:hypothetical protein